MTREPRSNAAEPTARRRTVTALATVDERRARLLLGIVAAFGALALALVRLATNAPVAVPGVSSGEAFGVAHIVAVAGGGVAAVALGVVAADDFERVGLVAAGVFGTLSLATATLTGVAAAVIATGGLLVGASRLEGPTDYLAARRSVPVAVLLAGLVVSLGAAAGVAPVALRRAGSVLTLGGLAVLPVAVDADYAAWGVGALAGVGAVAAGTTAPFVAGAVELVVGGVVGAPLVLVGAGVAGTVATATAGVRTRRLLATVGATLLLAGGAPASIQRALAVLLGLTLVSYATCDTDGETA
jgi:hypothetical protein